MAGSLDGEIASRQTTGQTFYLERHTHLITDMHESVAGLIDAGKKRGYVTYDELNTKLPDEMVEPDKLDMLLVRLDSLGIKLVDQGEHDAAASAAAANRRRRLGR